MSTQRQDSSWECRRDRGSCQGVLGATGHCPQRLFPFKTPQFSLSLKNEELLLEKKKKVGVFDVLLTHPHAEVGSGDHKTIEWIGLEGTLQIL